MSKKSAPKRQSQDFKSGQTRPGNGLSSEIVTSMPRSLVAALPTATVIMHHVRIIADLKKKLAGEMAAAKKSGPVTLARAYVVLYKMSELTQDLLSISDSGKAFGPLIQQCKTTDIPETFEQAGVPHVTLDEGYRVGVSETFRASIMSDKKLEAYAWLRANGLPDLISETVNASTLSAALKKEVEEKNVEPPVDLFKYAFVPNVSVTATK